MKPGFVSDTLADGRRFRVLVVVDDFTRECLALVADTSLSGRRVVRELDRLIELRSRPLTVVSEIRSAFRVYHDQIGNLPPMPAIFPDQPAPIVRTGKEGERELILAR